MLYRTFLAACAAMQTGSIREIGQRQQGTVCPLFLLIELFAVQNLVWKGLSALAGQGRIALPLCSFSVLRPFHSPLCNSESLSGD